MQLLAANVPSAIESYRDTFVPHSPDSGAFTMGRKSRSKNQRRSSAEHADITRTASASAQPPKLKKKANDQLRLNEKFAAQYDATQRRKLLNTVPSVGGNEHGDNDDSSSDSTSEDEDDLGELLTKRIDRRVQETIDAIRAKDPRIYDSQVRFFDDAHPNHGLNPDNSDSDEENEHENDKDVDVNSDDEPVAGWDTIAKAALSSAQKLTIKDYVRESLLKHGNLSDGEDESNEDEWEERPDYDHERDEVARAAASSFVFSEDANKGGDHDEQNDVEDDVQQSSSDNEKSDSDGDLFTKREKTAEEIAEEEEDFEKFLHKTAKKRSEKAGQDMLLHSYLENETPDEKERFLRDFVLNNGWLNRNAADAPSNQTRVFELDLPVGDESDGEDDDGSGDGNDDDKFDDDVDAFEASYNFRFEDPDSTKIATHSREVTGSLRRPDERRKKARRARLQRKLLEKAARAEELKQIKNAKKREIEARLLAIREAAGDDAVDLKGMDLEGDYDPDKFDKQMQERFGDEYYSREDDEMADIDTGEGATATEAEVARKGNSQSRNTEGTNPDQHEDVDRLMDEYYKLDYEDIVGGMPVRFKYKEVEPESFNLSAEEILAMDDKELNQMVSIKLLAPYRSRRDVQKQAWKVRGMKRNRGKKVENVVEGERDSKRKLKNELKVVADNKESLHETPKKPKRKSRNLETSTEAGDTDGDNRHKRKRRKKKNVEAN